MTVTAPADGGNAVVNVSLPAIISCDKGDLKPRKPNVRGIMMAKKAQVDVREASAPASTVTLVSQTPPPAKPAGKTYEGGQSAAGSSKTASR